MKGHADVDGPYLFRTPEGRGRHELRVLPVKRHAKDVANRDSGISGVDVRESLAARREPPVERGRRSVRSRVRANVVHGPQDKREVVLVDDVPVEQLGAHRRDIARAVVERAPDAGGAVEAADEARQPRTEDAEPEAARVHVGGPVLAREEGRCVRKRRRHPRERSAGPGAVPCIRE